MSWIQEAEALAPKPAATSGCKNEVQKVTRVRCEIFWKKFHCLCWNLNKRVRWFSQILLSCLFYSRFLDGMVHFIISKWLLFSNIILTCLRLGRQSYVTHNLMKICKIVSMQVSRFSTLQDTYMKTLVQFLMDIIFLKFPDFVGLVWVIILAFKLNIWTLKSISK